MSAYSKWNYWGTWTKARCTIDASLTASRERHASVSLVWLNLTFPFFRQFSSETFRRFWRTPRAAENAEINLFTYLLSSSSSHCCPICRKYRPVVDTARTYSDSFSNRVSVCLLNALKCDFQSVCPPPPLKKMLLFWFEMPVSLFSFQKCYSKGIEKLIRSWVQLFFLPRLYLILYRHPFSN